jgi:hypothetical protein
MSEESVWFGAWKQVALRTTLLAACALVGLAVYAAVHRIRQPTPAPACHDSAEIIDGHESARTCDEGAHLVTRELGGSTHVLIRCLCGPDSDHPDGGT